MRLFFPAKSPMDIKSRNHARTIETLLDQRGGWLSNINSFAHHFRLLSHGIVHAGTSTAIESGINLLLAYTLVTKLFDYLANAIGVFCFGLET